MAQAGGFIAIPASEGDAKAGKKRGKLRASGEERGEGFCPSLASGKAQAGFPVEFIGGENAPPPGD